jgi:PAS domain S-box-containing protein
MKNSKIVVLALLFFILICFSDAIFESILFHKKSFLDALILDVSIDEILRRVFPVVIFVMFYLVAFRIIRRETCLSQIGANVQEMPPLSDKSLQVENTSKVSEERLRHIFEKSPVMMHLIDEMGNFLDVNDRWLEVMGYSKDEILGHNVSFVMTQGSAVASKTEVLPRLWREGTVRDVPYQYIKKDGIVIDILLDSVVMNDPVWGRVSLSSVRNITLRKKAEEESRRTKALLDSIIQNLPTAVFVKEADRLSFVFWNKTCEDLYGYKAKDVIGKTAKDLFREAVKFENQDREVLNSGRFLEISEQEVATQHDGIRILHSKKVPIIDENGRATHLVGISEDITELKLAEKNLISAREAAEQASRAKSSFLANMSHEIRTPMNGVLGMTELALNTDLTAEQREYLEAVKISAESLLRLINDILDFSKIEAGKFELVEMDFSLRDSIANAMMAVSLQAHSKGLELAYHIPPNVPDVVVGDPGRLNQIMINLLGNSIKFTPKGEVSVDVQLEKESEDELFLHFSIRDTGIGIPKEKQAKIFNAFEQADGSTTRKYGGTGLGLAVSTQLVQMMGGEIWLDSEVGAGSTFHFTTRLGLKHGPLSDNVTWDISMFKDLPVLVVDDNDTNRFILHEMLSFWGMKPVAVEGATAALDALKIAKDIGKPFVLVLLDHMMPDIDGFELAERINSDPGFSGLAKIMLTSAGQRGDAHRCLNLGISAYCLKPIKQSELLNLISKALNKAPDDELKPSLITRHSLRERRRFLKVLLAEDNVINQKLAATILQKMGHLVTIAENGEEALRKIENSYFDVILMDVQMPEMDGFQATRAIREKEKITGGHTPIFAMTAHAMSGDREKCLAEGMDGYISKPINAQELLENIDRLVSQRETTSEGTFSNEEKGEIVDKALLIARVGGDVELLDELVDLFMKNSSRMLCAVEQAVHEGRAETIEKAAHSLKGSVGNFAADRAFQAAMKLETMGREGRVRHAEEALKNLEREISLLKDALSTLRNAHFRNILHQSDSHFNA